MKRFLFLFVLVSLCTFLFPSTLSAQPHLVTGVVTSSFDNTPIEGAMVVLKGTSIGTITGSNGSYQILASSSGTLQFSAFGYDDEEVAVDGRYVINIQMSEICIVNRSEPDDYSRSVNDAPKKE